MTVEWPPFERQEGIDGRYRISYPFGSLALKACCRDGENMAAGVPLFGTPDVFRMEAPLGVKLALTMVPAGPYVSAAGEKFEPGKADASIEQILAQYRDVPIDWWVGPESLPADLGERLVALGFTRRETIPGMAVDLDALVEPSIPEGLTVSLARGKEGWRQWIEA